MPGLLATMISEASYHKLINAIAEIDTATLEHIRLLIADELKNRSK